MSIPTLQEQYEAAINARQRILTNGQEVGFDQRRLRQAELTQINKTIASLEIKLSREASGRNGRPSSLDGATVDFGCNR